MSLLEILVYAAPVAAGLAFLATPWGVPVLAFLAGSRVGRWIALAGVAAYAVLVGVSTTYRRGKRAGAAEAIRTVERANARAVESRHKIERQVGSEDERKLRSELKDWGAMLLVAITLAGCASAPTGGKGGAFCDTARPIRLSAEVVDKMTRAEVEAAVAHNRHGARECAWRAKP